MGVAMSDAPIRRDKVPQPAEAGQAALRALAAALGRRAARELFRAATGAPAARHFQADVAALETDANGPRTD